MSAVSVAFTSFRPNETRRLGWLIAVSLAVHIVLLSRLPSLSSDLQRRFSELPAFDITLERVASKETAPMEPPTAGTPRRREAAQKQESPPRLDLGLDNPLLPNAPRFSERRHIPGSFRSMHIPGLNALSDAADTIETPSGVLESHRITGRDTTVRYVSRDGTVRCFFLRHPDPNNSFDSGAVLVGRGC